MLENKQLIFLGLSSSLTSGVIYSCIVSLGYFTPSVGIVAGLIGGMGIAINDMLSGKKYGQNIPLKSVLVYALFGIIALILGYIFVYYFIKYPYTHGVSIYYYDSYDTIYAFFKYTFGLYDIFGAVFGSISASAIPIIFSKKTNYS